MLAVIACKLVDCLPSEVQENNRVELRAVRGGTRNWDCAARWLYRSDDRADCSLRKGTSDWDCALVGFADPTIVQTTAYSTGD